MNYGTYRICEQRRLRRAWASLEHRQRLNCPHTHRGNVDEGACLNFGK